MRKWIPWAAFLAVVIAVMLSIPTTVDPIVARTVADEPLPPSPPCPPGSDCAETYPCSTQTTSSAEFETRWTAVGNNRMMSSPHATDLNGDSVLDIVVGTGAEESHSGSIIAVDGATGSLLWEMETDGEIIFQKRCDLALDESLVSLREKIRLLEYEFFPKIIEKLLN